MFSTRFSRSFLAAGAASSLLLLSGCGAANNAINNNIPAVDNLLSLNGQSTDATVGAGRAVVSGSGTKEVPFNDRSLSQGSKLKFVKFDQNLASTVTLAVPPGAALPAQFTLSNITLTLTARDDAPRSVSVSNSVSGPITFVQVAGSPNQYQASATIGFSTFEIKDNFPTFYSIVTSAPSPNFASGKVSFDADDTQLPVGSVLTFQMIDGKAKIGL